MRALALCLVLGACAGSVTDKSLDVAPGAARAEVVSIMGKPDMRSFRGRAEALQYCSLGFQRSSFVTVWLLDAHVIALTTRESELNDLSCDLREVDWGQAPPDVRIALVVNDQ